MEKIATILDEFNKPIIKEQLEKIIYSIFYIFIFISPIIPEQIGFGIYSLKYTFFNIVTIIVSLSLIIINIKNIKLNIYNILLIVYLILVVLSTIFTSYGITNCILGTNGRGEGVITIFSYFATFTIFMRGYSYFQKDFKVAIIGAIIVSVYGIVQANAPLNTWLPFGTSDYLGVAESTMGNQNFLSSYLCMFLPMMCYYFLSKNNSTSILVIALLFVCFVFAKTLGGYLVFIVMYTVICIFCFICCKEKFKILSKILILTICLVLLFMGITIVKGNNYLKEIQKTGKEVEKLINESEKFGTNRLAIWKRTIMAIENNALFGVGPDSLKKEFQKEEYHVLKDKDILIRRIVDKAHCEYLQIAVTTGIPSLIIYLLLLIYIVIRMLRIVLRVNISNKNKEKIFITMTFIGIVSYLAQAIGNISVIQVAPVFWAVLGLGAGITLNENLEKNKAVN